MSLGDFVLGVSCILQRLVGGRWQSICSVPFGPLRRPSASPAGAGGARQNNSWQPSTSRAWQGEHGAKTWASSQAQARAVHRKPQHGRPSAQAGGLAGICSEHVRHGSRVAMEGIHQGKTARRRCRAKVSACVVPRSSCPLDAPRSSCCPAALSASPLSPAPPPLCMLHIF